MTTEDRSLKSFETFMKVRIQASTDFLEGNFESFEKISTMKSPATIFPPSGVCIQGAIAVNHFNENGAHHFLPPEKHKKLQITISPLIASLGPAKHEEMTNY